MDSQTYDEAAPAAAEWTPTPPDEMIVAAKRDGSRCEYKDLKPGDVFQAVHINDGKIIDPLFMWGETALENVAATPDLWAVCCEPPVKGYLGRPGYAVHIETGSLGEIEALAKQIIGAANGKGL